MMVPLDGTAPGASRTLVMGAAAQLGLVGVALAAAAAPLGWHGRAAAFGLYGVISLLVVLGLGGHALHRRFGPANGATLVRAAAVALLFGIYAEIVAGGILPLDAPLRWALTTVAAASLLLDGVDGWLARRHGIASPFGARFDMETDALFILVLALLVHAAGQAGLFVLASGLIRYGFVAAGRLWLALRAPLPPSLRRKAGCGGSNALLIRAPAAPRAAG